MRVFSYKITRDFGFAPNPFWGFCTLATCKPVIRKCASVGDIVLGCGSSTLKLQNRLIFAMRVEEKLTFDQYWEDPRFQRKKPTLKGSISQSFGDNIYHTSDFSWKQEDSHHSFEGGLPNFLNMKRDLSANSVLVSRNFAYWGSEAIPIPWELSSFDEDSIYPMNRSDRSRFSPDFVEIISNWFDKQPQRGYINRPTSWSKHKS